MTYGSGGGWGDPDQEGSGYGHSVEPRRGASGAVLVAVTLLAVLVLLLIGLFAYLLLRPGGLTGPSAGQAAATSSTVRSEPATETAYATPEERETVTVTRQAPQQESRPPSSAGYPVGADRSGWTTDSQARCNAGDRAAMIGRTTQASFSICVNPDNGRYYYRGSSGGAGVEVDDPAVSAGSATVSNNNVVYSIDAGGMTIYEGGQVISTQPMIEFWSD